MKDVRQYVWKVIDSNGKTGWLVELILHLFEFLTIDSEYRINIDNLIKSIDASMEEISGSSGSISVDVYESKRWSVR